MGDGLADALVAIGVGEAGTAAGAEAGVAALVAAAATVAAAGAAGIAVAFDGGSEATLDSVHATLENVRIAASSASIFPISPSYALSAASCGASGFLYTR